MWPTIFVPSFMRISSAAAGTLAAKHSDKAGKNLTSRITPPGLAHEGLGECLHDVRREMVSSIGRRGRTCSKAKPVRMYSASKSRRRSKEAMKRGQAAKSGAVHLCSGAACCATTKQTYAKKRAPVDRAPAEGAPLARTACGAPAEL